LLGKEEEDKVKILIIKMEIENKRGEWVSVVRPISDNNLETG